MSLKNKVTISIILTCFLFALTYLFFGYHYGWIDDVLQDNYFRGIPLFEPIDYFYTVHILLSQLYRKLYELFPQIGWYGLFFGLWIFLATVNLCIFLLYKLSEYFKKRIWPAILFIIIIYFLIWIENVYLINFSRVAISLMGTSFLNIHRIIQSPHSKSKYLSLLYFSITFLIGLLTRPELSFLILPFLVIYAFWGFKNIRGSLRVLCLIILMLCIYKGIDSLHYDEDVKTKREAVGHLLNITDGLNTYDLDTDSLRNYDIKYRALALYYFPDSSFMNKGTLNKMGPGSAFSWLAIKNIKKNLLSEYEKARYEFEVYHRPMNWLWKSLLFTLFNVMLLLMNLIRLKRHELRWQDVVVEFVFITAFFSTVFFITILSKMEDRVLNPAFIIFSIAHLCMWADMNKEKVLSFKRTYAAILLLVAIILMAFQVKGYHTIHKEKREELSLKAAFINELNTDFKDKIFFYDLWTMTLLHQSPLSVIHLDTGNIHTSYGEYWCNFMPGHYKRLQDFCGNTDFISFYKCLYEKRDKVIFIFSKIDRKELLEAYSEKVYGERVRFKEINPNSALKKIHYSFLPYYYEFGYYVFDDSFSDAPLKNANIQ